MGKTESESFKYVGFNIRQDPETFAVTMDQEEYAEKIEKIIVFPERALKKSNKTTAEETTEMRKAVGDWDGWEGEPDLIY